MTLDEIIDGIGPTKIAFLQTIETLILKIENKRKGVSIILDYTFQHTLNVGLCRT